MGPLGVPELIIILFVALIFFGPRKLPELGRSIGRSLNEFKRASNELRSTLDEEIRLEERNKTAVAAPAAPPAAPAEATSADPSAAAPEPETVARGQHGS
jgi:TatA/E family protein of Tat protein translocase